MKQLVNELLADLRDAATTLRRYETYHRAKGTEESALKAEVNATLAARFERTIAKAEQELADDIPCVAHVSLYADGGMTAAYMPEQGSKLRDFLRNDEDLK